MPKIVELRQDRNLIRSNFDGYKLSLDKVPIIRQDISCFPLKAELNDEQYSLLHAELFSMQNLLVADPWSRTQSYFVNRLGEITRCAYDESKGRPEQLNVVYRLEVNLGEGGRRRGDYNYSFRFLSEKFCLVCDGIKTLKLFETGNRSKAVEWKLVATCQVSGQGIPEDEKNYTIFDSRLDIIQEQKQISAVLGHVQRVDLAHRAATHLYYLHWVKWTLEESTWKFKIIDTLEGKGSIYYCAFEPRAESVVLSSNHVFKWRSENSQENGFQNHHKEEKPHLHEEVIEENIDFSGLSWTQTDEDLVLKFEVNDDKSINDISVDSLVNKIIVSSNQEILLELDLFDKIDPELTTWIKDDHILQITLIKNNSGLLWTSLLTSGLGPRECSEKNLTNRSIEQQPIVNLEAPIEDCDFPMGAGDDEISVSRFNLATRTITHTIIIGSTPPLFATSLRPGYPYALATRQDVDCCLWLQQYSPSKPDEWSMRHEGNLHAFGYVQASKQQKKFVDCSPDLGYAIIAESHRHIFLYKTKYDSADGLRNRNGPQVTIGKQHLITLEDVGEVLGITTANSVSTLLTEKCILFLQVES